MNSKDILNCILLVIGIVLLTPILFSILLPIMTICLFILSIFLVFMFLPVLITVACEKPCILIILLLIILLFY